MKLLKHITCIISCVALPAYADSMANNDDGQYYIKPYLGLSALGDSNVSIEQADSLNGNYSLDSDTGFVSGLAIGYRLQPNWTVELAWEYRSNDTSFKSRQNSQALKGDNIASNTFWLNGYYHFKPFNEVYPYVGAGVGWIEELDVDYVVNGEESSFSDSGAAFQLVAGAEYPFAKQWSADVQVRYMDAQLDTLDAESGAGKIDSVDYDPLSLQLGIKYHF